MANNHRRSDPPVPEAEPPSQSTSVSQAAPPENNLSTDIDVGLPLFDEASSLTTAIAPELDIQKKVAADRTRPLEARLEAFEDIMDSEIGDTSTTRARNLEREFSLRQIFLKFDGNNPTGTQKDRIAFAQALDAMRRRFDAITVATCGNYGVAISLAASVAGLRAVIYIPEAYHTKRVQEMIANGAEIVRVPVDYETAVEISRKRAEMDEIYDANPGGANTALHLKAYGEIAYEIYDDLRDAPDTVVIPVSNGTTLAGIYRGFLSLYRRGKTSRIPHIIAGSSYGKNPIIQAFLKNAPTCEDLKPEQIKETVVNEPLINWHSIDGDLALEAIRKTGGWASYASDKNMTLYAKLLREREGLSVLPASTAGLAVLMEKHRKEPLPIERYVVIITGRK
jgi:threonine synthase